MLNLSGIEAAQCINAALHKTAGDLVGAVKSVHQGKTFFSPEVTRILMEDYVREMRTRGAEDSYDLLTPREREILQEKLNLHSLAELILYAVSKGVIS